MNALKRIEWGKWGSWSFTLIAAVALVVAVATYQRWLPATQQFFSSLQPKTQSDHDHHDDHDDHDHDHDDHDHDHDDHDHDDHDHGAEDHDHDDHDDDSLELSPVAWKNLGLRTGRVQPSDFQKTVAVTAMVVERPGRSQINIPAPMTGVVSRIYALEGEKVETGQPLFDLRLTHEDVVSSQKQFIESIHELEIAQREMERLKSVTQGVIARKKVIDQEYALEHAQTMVDTQRQSLFLHGLTEQQIDEIGETQTLLHQITIYVPPATIDPNTSTGQTQLLHVQSIDVNRGQHVSAGTSLGKLADHSLLYVEGNAFAEDARQLEHAAKRGDRLQVRSVGEDLDLPALELPVLYVADQVDPDSRALKFYLLLHNEMIEGAHENQFVLWKYRPGERMDVRVPVSRRLTDKLVLPATAVAIEGPNAYVFEQNGDHFDRLEVQILHRDRDVVVLENDGSLVGSTIALTGAYDMHLEIKNQSGAGVDPHAGHSH